MNARQRSLIILLIVVAMVLAFLLGTASVGGSAPSVVEAVSLPQWAILHTANSLLLDQGSVGVYLPLVLQQ